ncbi:MAG: hypothetical protein ABR509_05285 [Candidatus Limnocylindria bacterium]
MAAFVVGGPGGAAAWPRGDAAGLLGGARCGGLVVAGVDAGGGLGGAVADPLGAADPAGSTGTGVAVVAARLCKGLGEPLADALGDAGTGDAVTPTGGGLAAAPALTAVVAETLAAGDGDDAMAVGLAGAGGIAASVGGNASDEGDGDASACGVAVGADADADGDGDGNALIACDGETDAAADVALSDADRFPVGEPGAAVGTAMRLLTNVCVPTSPWRTVSVVVGSTAPRYPGGGDVSTNVQVVSSGAWIATTPSTPVVTSNLWMPPDDDGSR